MLTKALRDCGDSGANTIFGGYVHPPDRGLRILIMPKSEGVEGVRIEGNIILPGLKEEN